MESLEINKVAGGLLGALLFTMAVGLVTDIPFSHAKLAKPGYDLPAAADGETAGAAEAAPAVPCATLLASADAKKGQAATAICASCHSFDPNVQKTTGPNLVGVVGRDMGSTGFGGYSDTMKNFHKKWDDESLNAFLTKPGDFVKGTKMTFAGEKDPKKRADIIAYLNSISGK
jgi:cytochrome c